MALSSIYKSVHKGAMTLVGNTLCVNRDASSYTPNVWMSTIPTNQVAGYLGNTVASPANAYSSATLNIPSTCTVKFARLLWYSASSAVPNVKMVVPDGTMMTIAATITLLDGTSRCQMTDITNIINTYKSGEYTVGNFIGLAAYAGWTIIVIYEEPSMKFRYFNAYMGIQYVTNGSPGPLTFTNFITPSSGPVKGYLGLAYGAGDLVDMASFKVGPTIPNNLLGNLSVGSWDGIAPYNKSTDMFGGYICFADCNDLTTLGLNNNQSTLFNRIVDPYAGTYAVSGRALYDITGLDISSTLQNSQTELYTTISFAAVVPAGAHSLIQAVQIDMNSADIIPVKGVDKTTALPGETLLYTMVLRNTGLLNADNVTVVDTLPNGVSFVAGSLKVNGVTVSGSVTLPGYVVGTILFSSTATLTFNVVVSTIPPAAQKTLSNSYSMIYSFTPITTPQRVSAQSNIVITTIPAASLIDIKKTVNKKFADIGDFLIYTVTIPNTGNRDAENVVFSDTIPSGTTFVQNSFALNSVTIPGANPGSGINIGTIAAGGISTLTFAVQVTTIPTPNPMPNIGNTFYYSYGVTPVSDSSNLVQTQVNNATIDNVKGGGMVKAVDKKYANVGEVLTYTVELRNTGNVTAANVTFTDTIPNDTTFVSGSVSVNGVTVPGSPAPPIGVNISTIPAGSVATVTFKVSVSTIPSPNPIPNNSTVSFVYTIDPSVPNGGSGTGNSNQVTTQINKADLGNITKVVDKKYASCGEIITYTIVIPNTGNVTAQSVIFKDTIPNGTVLVVNSVIVNGMTQTGANPATGVTVPNIGPGAIATVTFSVIVQC